MFYIFPLLQFRYTSFYVRGGRDGVEHTMPACVGTYVSGRLTRVAQRDTPGFTACHVTL
jgi:hypothetical protein